jgi:hypothetical protein
VSADGQALLVEGEPDPGRITWLLGTQGIWLRELVTVRPGLESVFLELTAAEGLPVGAGASPTAPTAAPAAPPAAPPGAPPGAPPAAPPGAPPAADAGSGGGGER